MNGVHDMGGTHGHGPVVAERDEPVFHEPWEGRVYGLMRSCLVSGLFNLDEMRFAIERMPPAEYLRAGYYEKWLAALERLVPEKLAQGPSGRNPRPPAGRAARWRPGDRVRARNLNPPGHIRLPRYARGKAGRVELVSGPWLLPDLNAELKDRRFEHVYTVRFASSELFGEAAAANESVSIDLWESYLEDV